jgi:hypothetical protein
MMPARAVELLRQGYRRHPLGILPGGRGGVAPSAPDPKSEAHSRRSKMSSFAGPLLLPRVQLLRRDGRAARDHGQM